MARYKIHFNKKVCIGSGACASVCPENWEMVETPDGLKARPKKTEISEAEYESNMQATEICPVDAIEIEKQGKKKNIAEEDDEKLYEDF